jgi:regulator of protease activity HflC (stomatin/prohibitin superfamily)
MDAIKAVYEVQNLHKSLIELVLNELRSLIGSRNLDEILSSRSEISEKVSVAVASTASRWGISITSIEIKELTTDTETREAMLRQMEAERISRSTALQAEGESTAKIRLAEAERQAAILRAQGAAEALRLAAEAEAGYVERLSTIIGAEAAAKVLMNRQALEGYATISTNPASTVYLPNSLPAVVDLKR